MPRKRAASETTGAPFEALLEELELLQDAGQTRLCVSAFVKLPSKKLYPDYYTLIETPISLHEIRRKASRGQYDAPGQFVGDFQLMYDNAVKYNDPASWIVEDARVLLDYVRQNASKMAAEDNAPDVARFCAAVLQAVIDFDFPGEGRLSGPFMANVDPDEYPDYFKLIEHPTSFSDVHAQIASGALFSGDSVAADLVRFYEATTRIFANAELYNDPSSLIHQDSKKLRTVFDAKFEQLQQALDVPKKDPIMLKLTLKKAEAPGSGEPPKKRRGRKPKKLIEEEQRQAALEAKLKREAAGELEPEEPADDDGELLAPAEPCAMGKLRTTPPISEVFIRRVAFTSSPTVCNSAMNTLAAQSAHQLSRAQVTHRALYPEVPVACVGTFFDYQFEPLGFSSTAYSVVLPQDSSPVVHLKVALHELIYNIKRDDLVDGHGLLKGKSEEDFMCSLFVNDEEVAGGCELTEEDDPADPNAKVLMLGYEAKMSYGLNVLNFELRLSPSLSKTLKTSKVDQEATEVAIAGRHTRHQLQRIKLNWDVERFTLYAVSSAA